MGAKGPPGARGPNGDKGKDGKNGEKGMAGPAVRLEDWLVLLVSLNFTNINLRRLKSFTRNERFTRDFRVWPVVLAVAVLKVRKVRAVV